MPLIPLPKPNIDARGRTARGRLGLACVVAGALAGIFWAIPTGSVVGWIAAVALLVFGLVGLIEWKLSWCVARACGIRTKI